MLNAKQLTKGKETLLYNMGVNSELTGNTDKAVEAEELVPSGGHGELKCMCREEREVKR